MRCVGGGVGGCGRYTTQCALEHRAMEVTSGLGCPPEFPALVPVAPSSSLGSLLQGHPCKVVE